METHSHIYWKKRNQYLVIEKPLLPNNWNWKWKVYQFNYDFHYCDLLLLLEFIYFLKCFFLNCEFLLFFLCFQLYQKLPFVCSLTGKSSTKTFFEKKAITKIKWEKKYKTYIFLIVKNTIEDQLLQKISCKNGRLLTFGVFILLFLKSIQLQC